MSDRDHAIGLHDRLAAALAERDALRAERDRLVRILAVERGDEDAAPEGWRCAIDGTCWGHDSGATAHRYFSAGRWGWTVPRLRIDAPTALEVMEAALAALGGDDA